jgi:hypothetical protein
MNFWVKMEMFTGRIVTDKTLNSKAEAISENQGLIDFESAYRWIQSFAQLKQWEEAPKTLSAKEVMAKMDSI